MKKIALLIFVLLAGCATGDGPFSCEEQYLQCEAGGSQACVALTNCCAGVGKAIDTGHCYDYAFDL